MVKRNISFYERKTERNYYKNMNFARKEVEVILWSFGVKETLISWIYASKKISFSTQEVDTKSFLSIYEALHMLRIEIDDLPVLKKTIRCYFFNMEYVWWLLKSSFFGLSGDGKHGIFRAKKLMEWWYCVY